MRVVQHLEREREERLVEAGLAAAPACRLSRCGLDRGQVERRRQVVDDRVEQRLDALVLAASEPHSTGIAAVGEGRATQGAAQHARLGIVGAVVEVEPP